MKATSEKRRLRATLEATFAQEIAQLMEEPVPQHVIWTILKTSKVRLLLRRKPQYEDLPLLGPTISAGIKENV